MDFGLEIITSKDFFNSLWANRVAVFSGLFKEVETIFGYVAGNVVYDINGEWDAIIEDGAFGKMEDILKITQEGNKFVGIILNGKVNWDKGDELIKGELVKNGFKSIKRNTYNRGWLSETIGKIDEGCNKMVVKTDMGVTNLIITLNRK